MMVYAAPGSAPPVAGELEQALKPLVCEHKDVRFARVTPGQDLNNHTLLAQQAATTIELEGAASLAFPLAKPPTGVLFASMAENAGDENDREKAIWRLCSLLFDPLDVAAAKFQQGVPEAQVEGLQERMRMDALSSFWAREVVGEAVQDGVKRAKTAEEKALLFLTGNDVLGACDVLVQARDFKLAALVAQMPGSEQSRAMMGKQIQAWRERNDWSEMSEPVRALYSILAGQTCRVEGKSGAAENRAQEFRIADRFGLKWEQSFGLCLFFGGCQTTKEAIQAFIGDLDSGRETARPTSVWSDGEETADALMELMRLCAGKKDPATLFDPRVISGSRFNARLAWQLASLFRAAKHCDVPLEMFDRLTYDFAMELEVADKFILASWALLHLSDRQSREKATVGLLERNAAQISAPDPSQDGRSNFESLTEENHIPAPLVWRAKALYANAVLHDAAQQAAFLLRAGDAEEAHTILCTVVGPRAVIEQDYDSLANLLEQFARVSLESWQRGGQVYVDFVRLVRARRSNKRGREVHMSMRRLQKGLAGMENEGGRKKTLEERVAEIEMGKVLGEAAKEFGDDVPEDAEMGGMDVARADGSDMLRRYQMAMGMVEAA